MRKSGIILGLILCQICLLGNFDWWFPDQERDAPMVKLFFQTDLYITAVRVLSPGNLANSTGIAVTVELSGGSNQPIGKGSNSLTWD